MGFLSRFLANLALRALILRIATGDVVHALQPAIPMRRGTEKLQSPDAMLPAQLRDGFSALFDEIDHGPTIPCRQRIGILLFSRAACSQFLTTEARAIFTPHTKGRAPFREMMYLKQKQTERAIT
ncbi:MAG: hypothetical protein WA117_00855 [Verrucomicrobiia bacterium]